MTLTNLQRAETIVHALPYIQKYYNKVVVIKYGGNAMINEELKNSVMEDITLLKFIGLKPIVVHGGGPDISTALNKMGIKSKFINGLRVTDEETIKVALSGLSNTHCSQVHAGQAFLHALQRMHFESSPLQKL